MDVVGAFMIVFGMLAVFFGTQAPSKPLALSFIAAGLLVILIGMYQIGG